MKKSIVFIILMVFSCGLSENLKRSWEEKFCKIEDGILNKYPEIFSFDRYKYGFPPLPLKGTVKIEIVEKATWSMEYPPPNYDIMMHICETFNDDRYTYRTIGLKYINAKLSWISEQITFRGLKKYLWEDSETTESLTLTYEIEQNAIQGKNVDYTVISYNGPDKRLIKDNNWPYISNINNVSEITLSEIKPILKEWGYDY